jgi:ribosomal protein S18 acetylase RimI-like enzyme
METRFINKGEWNRQEKAIKTIEYACFKPGERTDMSWYKDLVDNQDEYASIIAVTRDKSKPVGCFIAAPLDMSGPSLKKWDIHYGKKDTLYLISIGVMPEYRHLGLGRQLMMALLKDARMQGYSRITMHTNNKGFVASCVKNGYRVVKTGLMEGRLMFYLEKDLSRGTRKCSSDA